MSVALMISNLINQEEEDFYVPIAAQKVFQDYWMPIIDMLDLKYAKWFQVGMEIGKEDLELVLKELLEIRTRIVKNMDNERGKQMIDRLDNLYKELDKLLKNTRNEIKVYRLMYFNICLNG